MAKIVIIPQTDRNYNPSKFELSVERLNTDNSYQFYNKYKLGKNLAVDMPLVIGDRIGLEYEGITQTISLTRQTGEDVTGIVISLIEEDLQGEIKIGVS